MHPSRLSLAAATLIATFASSGAWATEINAKLSGEQEVPPVDTRASGSAEFTVDADGSITGSVHTEAIEGVAAHIHEGAADVNGPVVVPLTKKNDHEWVTSKGARLTAEQMDAIRLGDLYVNVHTQAHPSGEIRGQLHE
jgi:CHRD domain